MASWQLFSATDWSRLIGCESFMWAGSLLAIGMEAVVKFRTPTLTRPIGLDVGRTVFAAFHKAQLGMVAVAGGSLLGAWACADKDQRARLMLPSTLLWITTGCLAIQDIVLQPRLSARASMTLQGLPLPPSRLHLAYVGLEGCKAVMLMVAGWRLTGMGAAVSSDDSAATNRMTDAAVADTHVARGAISPTRIPDQQAQERPHGPQQRPDDQQQEQEPYGQGE